MEGNIDIEQSIRSKPQFPTVEAGKLQETVQKNWQEHLLLFSQVKNRVIEVNDDVYFPVKLEKGKSSPLGLFAEAAFQEEPSKLPAGKQALEFWPKHGRSAILGRMIFADREGRIYRDIDLKGVGHLSLVDRHRNGVLDVKKDEYIGSGHSGLLDEDSSFYDYYVSEEFLGAGIRTSRVLGIIELEELIVKGKKLSLKEAAEKMGIVNEDFHPVIEVRAFGTKLRVDDIWRASLEEKQLIIGDAKRLVSQELGRQKTLSNEEYLEWFAKELGRNVGLMHKIGRLHEMLGTHNITLDCRIVDLDSVSELENNNDRLEDIESSRATIMILAVILISADNPKLGKSTERLKRQFQKSYNTVFPLKERDEYFKKFKKLPKETKKV